MKRIIIVIFALFFTTPISSVNALPVNLLESSYSYDLFQYYELRNYDVDPFEIINSATGRVIGSSSQPISRTLTLAPGHSSEITADAFSLSATGVSRSVDSNLYGFGYGHAFVSASWLFKPIGNFDGLGTNYLFDTYAVGYITLTDVTDNHEIYSFAKVNSPIIYQIQEYLSDKWEGPIESSPGSFPSGNNVINNLFVDNHDYEIKMGMLAQPYNDGIWTGWISADIQAAPVPEPGTLFSLGLALTFLAAFQRKKFIK